VQLGAKGACGAGDAKGWRSIGVDDNGAARESDAGSRDRKRGGKEREAEPVKALLIETLPTVGVPLLKVLVAPEAVRVRESMENAWPPRKSRKWQTTRRRSVTILLRTKLIAENTIELSCEQI
jgi:hypothetical protein